jgi:hypothetical protein
VLYKASICGFLISSPKAAHFRCWHNQACKTSCFNNQYVAHLFTKWNIWPFYLVLHFDSFVKTLSPSSDSKQFACYEHLKIFYSSFGVYCFLAIADTICNLKSRVWYQIKTLTIDFKMRPHPTFDSQNCMHNEWFLTPKHPRPHWIQSWLKTTPLESKLDSAKSKPSLVLPTVRSCS